MFLVWKLFHEFLIRFENRKISVPYKFNQYGGNVIVGNICNFVSLHPFKHKNNKDNEIVKQFQSLQHHFVEMK